MNKLIILTVILVSTYSFATINTFYPQETIKASDVNHNFNEVKQILDQKNTPINFNIFQAGDLIYKDNFEIEFNKVRSLGISIDELESNYILSEEINRAFNQTISGALNYDDIPVSNNINFSLDEDVSHLITFSYTNNVGAAQIEITTPPTHGVVVASGNTYIYTPNTNYTGSDSFSYRIFDGTYYSNISSANITINPINDNPIANSQSILTNEDTVLNIVLQGSDVENSNLSYTIMDSPSNGVLSGSGSNYQYTPSNHYFGTDSFTFKVNDGSLDSDVVSINISVIPINDPPNISGNQSLDILASQTSTISTLSGTDTENSNLTYSLASSPSKGIVSFGSNGVYTYTANLNAFGADSFAVRSFDGNDYSSNLVISVNISLPKSCKDLLALRPSLQNLDNTYFIDIDGSGPLTPANVLCDMTTANGGWTNLAANIGSFSNVFVANNNSTSVSITNSGISLSSNASSIVNGILISQTSDTIGGCMGNIRYLKLTTEILNYLTPTQVKLKARSYGTGSHSCGGLLRYSDINITGLTRLSPTNFDVRTLGRCDEGGTYPSTSNSADLTFYTTFRNLNFSENKSIGALEAQCGSGTSFVQYKEIWVR